MGNDAINEFYIKYEEKFNEPIIQNFLKEEDNLLLFNKALTNPTNENIDELNEAFSDHFKRVKIINYISKLIHFYSIDFDKKTNLNKKRYVLNLDAAPKGSDNSSFTRDIVISSKEDLTFNYLYYTSDNLKDFINDERIFKAFDVLTTKQIQILNLIYVKNLSNKRIAGLLKLSEQSVSYNHKAALKKIRKEINYKEEVYE